MTRILTAALCLGIASFSFGQTRILQVSVSETMAPSLKAIAQEFERIKPGVKIQVAVQAETDVVKGGQVQIGPVEQVEQATNFRIFARDPIVVVAPGENAKVSKFAHLASNVSVTWPTPVTLVGRHAQSLLTKAGDSYGKDWLQNIQRNKKETPKSSEEVVDAIVAGRVDAGIASLSEAKMAKEKVSVVFLPIDLANSIEYIASVDPAAKNRSLADSFVEFLFTSGNQLRLEGAGFVSPLRPPPELPVVKASGMLRLFTAALPTHPKETISAKDAKGRPQSISGVSLVQILSEEKSGVVTFTSADGTTKDVDLRRLRADGAVLVRMSDGNYQVVLGKKPPSQWVRWLRRIEIK